MSTCFTSALDRSYLPSLERLLFYNANQAGIEPEVQSVIERYGVPRIVEDSGKLRVVCSEAVPTQSLYALEPSDAAQPLIGIIVYTREMDTLAVLHLAVREDYTQRARPARTSLLLDMVDEVCNIGRRVKGVESVAVFPGTRREIRLHVAHNGSQ
jgi:hypothetical protein